MSFKKYKSIPNLKRALKWSSIADISDEKSWFMTEQVHGANLQIIINHENKISFASRNRNLEETLSTGFFNFSNIELSLRKSATQLKQEIDCKTLNIYGELFGGTKIQNDIFYQDNLKFVVFDVLIDSNSKQNKRWLNFGLFNIVKTCGFPVLEMKIGSLMNLVLECKHTQNSGLSNSGCLREGSIFTYFDLDGKSKRNIRFTSEFYKNYKQKQCNLKKQFTEYLTDEKKIQEYCQDIKLRKFHIQTLDYNFFKWYISFFGDKYKYKFNSVCQTHQDKIIKKSKRQIVDIMKKYKPKYNEYWFDTWKSNEKYSINDAYHISRFDMDIAELVCDSCEKPGNLENYCKHSHGSKCNFLEENYNWFIDRFLRVSGNSRDINGVHHLCGDCRKFNNGIIIPEISNKGKCYRCHRTGEYGIGKWNCNQGLTTNNCIGAYLCYKCNGMISWNK